MHQFVTFQCSEGAEAEAGTWRSESVIGVLNVIPKSARSDVLTELLVKNQFFWHVSRV